MPDIRKISLVALILALLAIAAAVDVSKFGANVQWQPQLNESVTFIPGQNIALSQDTANKTITITGAATWTLSEFNSTNIQTDTISGYTNTSNDTLRAIIFNDGAWLWTYVYNPMTDNIAEILHFSDKIEIRICQLTSGNCAGSGNDEIYISDHNIQIHADTTINGNVSINGKNLEQERAKTYVKSFQADYLNSSNIFSDIIIIPQNMNLTNITNIIEAAPNATNFTLNFSLERFTNYPTTKEIILSNSFNQSVTYADISEYSFNENDILLLNYTTYVNVSKSASLFKFKVR